MITRSIRMRRATSIFLLLVFVAQLITTPVLALTSGPSQPESQGFQPAGSTDMVDLFSGDFSYNIPLFELPGPNGGYPFNMSYQSGISMDQESSWVGLGWSLNPGAINRQVRGLPDEFKGDVIQTKTSISPSVTVGTGVGAGVELFGKDKALGLKLSSGFGVSYNSYKGMGYSIEADLGLKNSVKSGMTGSLGLGLGIDSQQGVSVSPSMGLAGKVGEFGLRSGYNSHSGLSSVSFSYDRNKDIKLFTYGKKDKDGNFQSQNANTSLAGGASLSLASPGYTPQVTMPMRNVNISATFKAGGAWWGVFGSAYFKGFYAEQWLKDNGKTIPSKAYGYMNYQKSDDSHDLLDFNREKDGMVNKESPNLAIPSMTYDIFSVTGQGIGAMYRPFRNDYGILHDQTVSSVSVAAGVGIDAAPVASHGGLNLSVDHSKSTSGLWTGGASAVSSSSTYQDRKENNLYEPWYFKVHGEPYSEKEQTISELGYDDAIRVKLDGANINPAATGTLENKKWNGSLPSSSATNQERKPRNQNIQLITNAQLINGTQEILPLFKIDYFDKSGTLKTYSRNDPSRGHHTAGLTALTADGLRYVYALPAYNQLQEEVSFSARHGNDQNAYVNVSGSPQVNSEGENEPDHNYANTDKFLRKTQTPAYAHSYLLTSIVGPDYVDVTGDGVTPDDLGYWVKFTYQHQTSDGNLFKWRDPYIGAHYNEGWKTDPRDDKGQYTYGERELWYLAKAETKSHIATFSMTSRNDGRGAKQRIQDAQDVDPSKGKEVYKLDEIQLASRFAPANAPIKTVKFEYDYSLCGKVHNGIGESGKLTLKKVWFVYGKSQRGSLNPYEFSYNPGHDYDLYAYDRWGTYKPYPAGNQMYNHDFPYSLQDPARKEEIDLNAAAWSLTQIKLPSGGVIKVDYESDDYAYVQHKVASQMVELVDPYTPSTQTLNSKYILNKDDLKIRFKLEKPIPGGTTLDDAAQKNEVKKYIDQTRNQLYFKIKVNLLSPSENSYEYISGYADIDPAREMKLEQDASGNYRYGYFYLLKEKDAKNTALNYHPFSVRAWQHLRTNQPELTNNGSNIKIDQTNDIKARVNQIKGLGSIVTQVREMFQGYYKFCYQKQWGRQIEAGQSWVRLNTPDKVKYGGGLRVKQITIKDNWAQDEEGIYGQVYAYTTQEGEQQISSGVATYEPLIGGEENSLRYAKKYTQAVPLHSDNNLFFEYPINETYYPGPQIGYSKVSVMSLAAASRAGKAVNNITLSDNKKLFPAGADVSFGTTGMTVNEFYTAKDFPVITSETDKQNKPFKLSVNIPFLGSIAITKLMTSQGYSIITNDMHGKQKKVSNYRQDRLGNIDMNPISWVQYNYRKEAKVVDQQNAFALSNLFKENDDKQTLSIPSSTDATVPRFYLGQETEFFMDMREFEDNTWGGGANFNIDINYVPVLFAVIPIPVPTSWPNVSKSSDQLRTVVTNKVIFRSGVLESTEVFNEGSKVFTKNLKWDKFTGAVVLTSVNNNFDAPVFSYSIPAYTQYLGMGAAYQNAGLTFAINDVKKSVYKDNQFEFTSPVSTLLFAGDEILVYPDTNELKTPVARVIYTGVQDGKNNLISDRNLTDTKYKCLIVRSGYRNQLSVQAGSITALQDPSEKGAVSSFNRTIKIPK